MTEIYKSERLLIWVVKERKVYEFIAGEKTLPSRGLEHLEDADRYTLEKYWEQIPISDLPLYIHWPYKTKKFENLLKGIEK